MNILYVRPKFLIHWQDPSDRQNSMPMCFRAKFKTKITAIIDCFEFLLNGQVILLHVVLHGHHISSITQLNILLVSRHKELPALFLKVGVDGLVIIELLRIQSFCQS